MIPAPLGLPGRWQPPLPPPLPGVYNGGRGGGSVPDLFGSPLGCRSDCVIPMGRVIEYSAKAGRRPGARPGVWGLSLILAACALAAIVAVVFRHPGRSRVYAQSDYIHRKYGGPLLSVAASIREYQAKFGALPTSLVDLPSGVDRQFACRIELASGTHHRGPAILVAPVAEGPLGPEDVVIAWLDGTMTLWDIGQVQVVYPESRLARASLTSGAARVQGAAEVYKGSAVGSQPESPE